MTSASLLYGADNEIYIDQSGATFNLDAEQLGSGNIIGGADAIAGTMTALDLDGGTQTIDINQIGSNNKFLGDITADNFVGFWEFDGSTNVFNVQIDPTNTYGADGSDVNVDVTGGTNTFTLDLATTALASNADVDWVINGDGNTLDFNINYTDAIRIPRGTTGERPTTTDEATSGGYIRYNTTNHQFEGYGPGDSWGSLGGVINVAQNTKILASYPDADSTNNELIFYIFISIFFIRFNFYK